MISPETLANNSHVSRRDFLKLSGLAPVALALPKMHVEDPNIHTEALWDFGLEKYAGVARQSHAIKSIFGFNTIFFSHVVDTLDAVMDGTISDTKDPRVLALKEGWETKTSQEARLDAHKRVESLFIDIVPATEDETEVDLVRRFLDDCADPFPLLILALPHHVISDFKPRGYAGQDVVKIESPTDKSYSPFIFLHEATHEADTFQFSGIRQYMRQTDYQQYLEEYFYQTYRFIVYDWLARPLSQVLRYVSHGPLIGQRSIAASSTVVDYMSVRDQILIMQEEFGFHVLSEQGVGFDEGLLPVNYWNVMIHEVGNHLLKLPEKERVEFIAAHSESVKMLFTSGIASKASDVSGVGPLYRFEGILTDVEHDFVNPVITDWQLINWRNPLIQSTLPIQEKRLNLYSQLPRHSGIINLRHAFGDYSAIQPNSDDPFPDRPNWWFPLF